MNSDEKWHRGWFSLGILAVIIGAICALGCAPARWQKGTTVIVLTTEPIQEQPKTGPWDVLVNIGDIPEDVAGKLPWPIVAERTIAHAATHRTSGFIFTNRPTGAIAHKFTVTVKKGQEVQLVAEPVDPKKE